MESAARKRGDTVKIYVAFILCIWSGLTDCQQGPTLLDYTPKSGPIAGGTKVNVTGTGFVTTGFNRSKCRFEFAARGSVLSDENFIHNETFLTCTLPQIEFLTDSLLQGGNRMTILTITGALGSNSNGVEFFLYDLEQIHVGSISPTEGITNSTNLTLSIRGENFLETNELTCSVSDSVYQVPAQYFNSSLLQCQLAPFPITAQVIIDISMNGQAVANIAPIMDNSTIFTYFASPPRIQSCRFTLSYAQLLLSFDREVEIGEEQRANNSTIPTSSSLSCSEIFMQETLQNVIGLNSICFWLNTQQREVIVELALDTSVQFGSQVAIKNDTIRTRYVQYSRLSSGNVTVSLPEMSPEFLPAAVIETSSIIPYCGNFTISGAKSQYGGPRDLLYMWIIGTWYDENGTLIQDNILADHIPTGFTSQSVLELSSDLFNPDLLGSGSGSTPLILASSFDIQLHVRNFIGFTSTARVTNITRAEIAQPSVLIVGGDTRRVSISDEITLEGRVILQSDACQIPTQNQNEPATYSWSVVDQFGRIVNLDDPPHSTVLTLPPNTLELGLEYTATLRVGFRAYSVVIEASATLITDVESFNLIARISGGIRRSFGMSESILLDGQGSQYVNTSSFVLDVMWGCITITSNEDCIDQNGQALSFATNSLVQVIPSGTLLPGEYNISLTLHIVSDSQDIIILEASAYQIVVIFPYLVPRVEIIQTDNDLESVLVHNELILNIGVQSNVPGMGQWTSEYVIGYAQLDLDNDETRSPLRYNITNIGLEVPSFSEIMPFLFTNNNNTSTPNSFANQISLIITSNTLLPQNSYRFKFTAYDKFGNSGFTELDIYTESVPTSGRLLIDPQNGSPLVTIFSLSAPGWTDNFGDMPLLYQFGLRYILVNLTDSSNSQQQLPPCCDLHYDNSLPSNSKLEDIICVCDFFNTGISVQNDLQTMLPFLPQAMNGVAVQTELLLRIFDKNGALSEVSQTLESIFKEPPSDDDATQPLRPLLNSPREQLDLLAMLDRIRQLSHNNWRDALAQLTTLVSVADVSSFNFSYFNLSQPAQIGQFKVKVMEIVINIYESSIPLSKPYLTVIASLVQSTTNSLNSYGVSLNDAQISWIITFLQVLVDSFNSFDEEQMFSLAGFSTIESQNVLKILQNLIIISNGRSSDSITHFRANSVTQELLSIIPKLGYGLCRSETHSFVNGASISFLKSSRTNLPTDYQSIEQCSARKANSRKTKYCLSEDGPKVTVNFSSALFERYLWWPCAPAAENGNGESELYCSGVCLTSAQHTQNLLWQGSEYESRLKSLLFQLYLINPQNGSILEAAASTVSPTRVTRNVAADAEQIDLVFPVLARYSNASNLQCAYWNETSRMWIRKIPFTGEMRQWNGIVTDVICHFEITLGSIFTVLEVCPDGYYGETCSNVCPEGQWGGECRGSCDCNNRGDCSMVDGSCDCDPGWMGDSCQTMCPAGKWGKSCLEVCLCQNGANCDHITGQCTCTSPGWKGTYCNVSCPVGLFGIDCRESCTCNKDDECNKMTGLCNCSAGFKGTTCHQMCNAGSYGLSCASECQCFTTGTRSCHHINGSCDCLDGWSGEMCDVEVTPDPPPEPTFQIWWAIVGVVAAVLLAVLVLCVIIIVFVVLRKKKRKKVLPITDGETGDHVSHHEDASNEVATDISGSSGSDLNITRAKSLEVLVPKGKELNDIFISPATKKIDGEQESDFKEPADLGGKLRWQIIRLTPAKSKSPSAGEARDTPPVDGGGDKKTVAAVNDSDRLGECNEELEELVGKEIDTDSSLEVSKITQGSPKSKYSEEPNRSESADDHMTEILYKRGVYLAPDATLKDLRNGFIEMEKLENNDRYFQLLKSDVPGDLIEVDTEDETLLSQIEHRLVQPRTVYIENIDPATVTMELCVCGKFADLECSECGLRGYCSVECQQDDWFKHSLICQEKIEEKKQRKKLRSSKSKKKKKHKKHKKHKKSKSRVSSNSTPITDVCVCGKEAEFECSRCERQGYCSEECQVKDWNVHQAYCKQSETQSGIKDESQQEKSTNDAGSSSNSSEVKTVTNELTPFNRSGLETLVEETESEEENK